MPIETDALSLVFIACFLFGLIFLLVTALLGNLGQGHAGTGAHHAQISVGGHTISVDTTHGVAHSHGIAHAHVPVHGQGQHGQQGQQAINQAQGHDLSLLSYLNPTSIVLFLLGFGFLGYVFHTTTTFILPLTLIISAVGGLVIATLLLWMIGRVFGDSEGATIQDVSDRTGLLGKVSTTIQENSIGEILYISPGGMRKSIPARSVHGERLERGQEVVVINFERGVADVETWDSFMNEEVQTPTQPQTQTSIPATDTDELEKLRALLEDSHTANSELVIRNDVQKE